MAGCQGDLSHLETNSWESQRQPGSLGGEQPHLDPVLPQACSPSGWEKSFPPPPLWECGARMREGKGQQTPGSIPWDADGCHRQEATYPSSPFSSLLLTLVMLTFSLVVLGPPHGTGLGGRLPIMRSPHPVRLPSPHPPPCIPDIGPGY